MKSTSWTEESIVLWKEVWDQLQLLIPGVEFWPAMLLGSELKGGLKGKQKISKLL